MSNANFPTATAMQDCLSGHCGNAATFYLSRTALAYLGLRLVGAKLYTYLGRSAIAGSGIYLADPANKHLIRDSLAAIAPVEVAVLAWARGG